MKVILKIRSPFLKRWFSFLASKQAPSEQTSPLTQPEPEGRPPVLPAPASEPPLFEPTKILLPQARREEKTIVIGVDFGTSTTKVMWQDLNQNSFEVIEWPEVREVGPKFLLPSTVLLRDGCFHFGVSESEVRNSDLYLKSLKLCALCPWTSVICCCGNPAAHRGAVCLPGSQESIPATALVSLFLANVFRQVEEGLQRRFPEVSLTLFWNVSCPIDHLDRKDLRSSWERMTGAAIELRHQISNPVPADILALATKLASSLIPPPKEERNYFVCPETLAAVKSFLESHKAESKTYAIVDVGAGTTEVSFFFNGRAMTEPGQPFRPSCLADSTQAIGGVNMDLELAELWKCSVLEARRQKERARHPIPSLKTFQEIRSQYWRTCGEIAKHKKLISPDDKRFDLFLIGGGGRLTSLRKALEVRTLPGNFVLETIRPLDVPEKLQDRSRFESDYDLLAIACGLASSLDWQYYQRDEVEPMHLPLKYSPSFEEQ